MQKPAQNQVISNVLRRRLVGEIEAIRTGANKDIPENISAGPISDSNILQWECIMIGPVETPYEGGVFKLSINIPVDYPYKPPKIVFKTPIFHPNIDTRGNICLDILKTNWSPGLTITKVLLSISSLLSDPNPDDPLRPDVAILFKNDKGRYDENARMFTVQYAH